MIYTITLNPALDRTLWIERIRDDISNRILEEHTFAGGKSVDVSRVLKNLGIDNTALGFVGRLCRPGARGPIAKYWSAK